MKTTSNLGLMKPEGTDVVDIENFNTNADTLDTTIGAMSTVPTTAKNIAGAIKEIHTAMLNLDTTISDGEITTAKLADSAVTTVKLAANAVTGAKMANSTVTATQLADGAVTSAKLADSGVSAGTYKSVTVDGKGRVTGGTNPTTLSGYGITDAAPLASPALTGTPTAPTAVADTSSSQLATTAFVLGQAGSTAPAMNGTAAAGSSVKYARADHVHPTDTTRAPLASPALTGTPTAPTAAVGTNTTQISTTAFVQGELGSIVTPLTNLQREVVNLKLLSTLKMKVDGASDFFYDDIASKTSVPDGSSMVLDITQATVSVAISAGTMTCTVMNATGLYAGMEVTIQHITNGLQYERRVIQSISGNTITFKTSVSSAYPIGSIVYRSLVNRLTSGSMKFQKASSIYGYFDFNGSTVATAPMTVDYGTFVYPDYNALQNSNYWDVQFGPGGDIMVRKEYNTLYIYRRLGDSYVTTQTISVSNLSYRLSIDGVWIFCVVPATAANQMPVIIYKLVNGTYVKIPDSNITGITVGTNWTSIQNTSLDDMQISPSTNYFGVAYHNSGYIYILKRTGDTFAYVNGASPSVNSITGFAWSYDDKFLAWTSIWNPNSAGVFKSNSGTWTSLYFPLPGLSNYSTSRPLFSPDGKYLYIDNATSSSYRQARLYTINGDTFTFYKTNSTNVYSTIGFFTADSKYLILPNSSVSQTYGWKMTTTDASDATNLIISGAPSMVSYWKMDPLGMVMYHTALGLISSANKGAVDVTTADIRYETRNSKSVSGMVAFIERSSTVPVTLTAALSVDSGTENPVNMTAEPDETVDSTTFTTTFSKATVVGTSATLRLTMSRVNTTLDPAITKVMGATE